MEKESKKERREVVIEKESERKRDFYVDLSAKNIDKWQSPDIFGFKRKLTFYKIIVRDGLI